METEQERQPNIAFCWHSNNCWAPITAGTQWVTVSQSLLCNRGHNLDNKAIDLDTVVL